MLIDMERHGCESIIHDHDRTYGLPWWGGWMYCIVTGVASDIGVLSTYLVILSCPAVFKIRSETCQTEAQFCLNLYMVKKESFRTDPSFASQGPQSGIYFEDWSRSWYTRLSGYQSNMSDRKEYSGAGDNQVTSIMKTQAFMIRYLTRTTLRAQTSVAPIPYIAVLVLC